MSTTAEEATTDTSNWCKKILSALFYAFASFMITIVNKTILTTYKFPSYQVLGIGQMAATIVVLFIGKKLKVLSFPSLELNTFGKVFPLPLIYIGNMIFGLGGTQQLSLPMFTSLRRFTILITMIFEVYILSIRPSYGVQFSVYVMVAGAVIAASNDLAFNLEGYIFVLINNCFASAYVVYTKKKLDCKELGKYGLLFYCSLFMVIPTVLFSFCTGDLEAAFNYEYWLDPLFLVQFVLSCLMGFILLYSVILCTLYNSALTTTIIGCIKNISVTYLGMIIGGDYIFSWLNFIGLNISVLGSFIYAYVVYKESEPSKEYQLLENEKPSDKNSVSS